MSCLLGEIKADFLGEVALDWRRLCGWLDFLPRHRAFLEDNSKSEDLEGAEL